MRRLTVASLILITALMSACGGDGPEVAPSRLRATSSSTDASTSTTASSGSADPSDSDYATTPVTARAPGKRAILTSVRVAGHPEAGYDRVVFSFREGKPGFTVSYSQGEVVQDGSGEVVEVKGDHTLEVRLEDTADFDDNGKSVFEGTRRVEDPTAEVILEAAHLSSFEGVVGWAIGTDAERPFRVELLSNPTRLVVDIKRSSS